MAAATAVDVELSLDEAEDAIKKYDITGNGEIEFNEFMQVCISMCRSKTSAYTLDP